MDVKINDFNHIYDTIKADTEIIVYTESGKFRYNIIEKNSAADTISYIQIDSDDSTVRTWNRPDFIHNKYNILDIEIEDETAYEMNMDYEILEDLVSNTLVAEEIEFTQKNTYEQIYTLEEQIEDMAHHFIAKYDNPTKYACQVANKRATTFGNLILNNRQYDHTTSQLLLTPRTVSNENPLLEYYSQELFISDMIVPIVSDAKIIFEGISSLYVDEEDSRHILLDDQSDIEKIKIVNELEKLYFTNKITLREFRKAQFEGARSILTDAATPEILDNISNTYIPIFSTENYYTMSKSASVNFNCFRSIFPSNPMLHSFGKARTKLEQRVVRGDIGTLVDDTNKSDIPVSSKVCSGTLKTSENQYFNKSDQYVAPGKQFNKSISREPILDKHVNGEIVPIIGFMIRSPLLFHKHHGNYCVRSQRENYANAYFIESTTNYNLMDKIIAANSRHLDNTRLLKNIVETTVDSIDYSKHQIVKFNKKIHSRGEFRHALSKIIPRPEHVFEIEYKALDDATTLNQIEKIFAKYFLKLENMSIEQRKLINEHQLNVIAKMQQEKKTEASIHIQYAKLNNTIHKIFNKIYDGLLFSSNVSLKDITYIMNKYIIKYDISLIDHILQYYFNNTPLIAGLESSRDTFIRLFYERYLSFTQTSGTVRLLLLPDFIIRDQQLVKNVNAVRRYYGLDTFELKHCPSTFGVLQEVLHIMSVKDGCAIYNALCEYQSISYENDTEQTLEIDNIVFEIDKLQKLIDTELTKNEEMPGHCLGHTVSKLYKSISALELDNHSNAITKDRLFDRTTILNQLYNSVSSTTRGNIRPILLEKVRTTFEFETTDWHNASVDALLSKKGLLVGEHISTDDWALVIDIPANIYQLFRRDSTNSIWVFHSDVPEKHRYAPIRAGFAPIDGVCPPLTCASNRRGTCIPVSIIELLHTKAELEAQIIYDKNRKFIDKSHKLRRKELDTFFDNLRNKVLVERVHKIQKMNTIFSKSDILPEIITEYNAIIVVKNIHEKYAKLDLFIKKNGDLGYDDEFIYYLPEVIESPKPIVLCCKHVLDLIGIENASLSTQSQLRSLFEEKWGRTSSSDRYKHCRNCADVIGNVVESTAEGFDANDRAINVREAVSNEPDEERDYSKYFKEDPISLELYSLLRNICLTFNIHLRRKYVFDIIYKTRELIERKSIHDFYAFEEKIINDTTTPIMPAMKRFYDIGSSAVAEYTKDRISLFGVGRLNANIIHANTTEGSRDVIGALNSFKTFHAPYVYFHQTIALLSRLIIMIHVVSDPPIKMYSVSGRFIKLNVVSEHANLEQYIQMFTQILDGYMANDDTFKLYMGIKAKGKARATGGLTDEHRDEIRNKLSEYLMIHQTDSYILELKERKTNARRFEIERSQQLITENAKWKTFRPILAVESIHDITMSKISAKQQPTLADSMQLSIYLFYSIHQEIKKAADVELKSGNAFSNYGCLSYLRSNYMDYFISKNENIQTCLKMMHNMQHISFYNPIQGMVHNDNDGVLPITPLMDYLHFARLDDTLITAKIKTLFKKFTLLPSDNDSNQSRVSKRIVNTTDTETLLEIETETSQQLQMYIHDLDSLYKNLQQQLNTSNNVVLSNQTFVRIPFELTYPDISQEDGIRRHMHNIADKLERIVASGNLFPQATKILTDIITKYRSAKKKIMLFTEWNQFRLAVKTSNEDLGSLLGRSFGDFGICQELLEEKIKAIDKQLRIEGFDIENEIVEQHTFRKELLEKQSESMSIQLLIKYATTIGSCIHQFKNYNADWNFINTFKKYSAFTSVSNELLEYDVIAKHRQLYVFFNRNEYKKNLVAKVSIIPDFPSVEILQLLQPNDEIDIRTVLQSIIISGLKSLLLCADGDVALIAYIKEYITIFIRPEIEKIHQLNCSTEHGIELHMRDINARENRARQERIAKMDETEQRLYRMFRNINLGDFVSTGGTENAGELSENDWRVDGNEGDGGDGANHD
jgi:hypothetical protein